MNGLTQEKMVKWLEGYLAKAKRGDYVAIAFVGVVRENLSVDICNLNYKEYPIHILGGLELIKLKTNKDLDI